MHFTRFRRAAALLLLIACLLGLLGCGADAPQEAPLILEGKTISILGDSISTFGGVSNDPEVNATLTPNTVYYKKGYYGVDESDTWWYQAAQTLGAEILVNNSWSGSCVFVPQKGEGSQGYSDRCVNLHDNTGREPDVVAIYLGTNDFNLASGSYGSPGAIDYDSLVAADGSYETPTTFCEAYALMLARIQHRYPDAEIYCFTVLDRKDLKGDTTRMSYFNGFIKAITQESGAHLVDLYEQSGITGENLSYAAYICDDYLHPSAAGMDAITGCFVSSVYENSAYVLDDLTLCSVGYDLDGVVVLEGNTAVVPQNTTFTCTLTSGRDAAMGVTVTMGGKDVTKKYYADGTVTIPSVTGDITISAIK